MKYKTSEVSRKSEQVFVNTRVTVKYKGGSLTLVDIIVVYKWLRFGFSKLVGDFL